MKNQSTMTDKVILRAQALAWAGKHTQAIETASHELGRHNLKPKMQMDLLDLRAESYIALGKLDLAAADPPVTPNGPWCIGAHVAAP